MLFHAFLLVPVVPVSWDEHRQYGIRGNEKWQLLATGFAAWQLCQLDVLLEINYNKH